MKNNPFREVKHENDIKIKINRIEVKRFSV